MLKNGLAVLSFKSWIYPKWKVSFTTTFCLRQLNVSQITLILSIVKKTSISNARFNEVEKHHLTWDFLSKMATSVSVESHHSTYGAEVCGNEDTDCIFFHWRTGRFTFTKIEKWLWMLRSQLSWRVNQSMTKLVASVLASFESHWFKLVVSPKKLC